jgi:large repetitive protein
VTLRDVNHDDVLDLLAATLRDADLSVLLGAGDGSFKTRTTVGNSGATALAVADFNRDSHEDVATTASGALGNTAGSIWILLGRGDGSFRREQTVRVGLNPLDIAAADINGDGYVDLVTSNNETPDSLSVLLGLGDGSFRIDRHLRVAAHDGAA